MALHKEIDVQIDLTDRIVNLQEDGYDVVIRRGKPPNSGLIRKPLSVDAYVIAASPHYLKAHGTPEKPNDLADHSCLVLGEASQWDFQRKNQKYSVKVSGRLSSDNGEMLLYGARAGLGIIRVSKPRVAKMLQDGYLKPLLAEFDIAVDASICALYPGSKHVLPKLRVFLDFLGDWFRAPHESGALDAANAVPIQAARPARSGG